jgi:hypothetical protein
MNNSITICDFGTAPEQKKLGYKLTGFEICCKENELASFLRLAGDIRVVRGGLAENDEEAFFVMIKCDDAPVVEEKMMTVDQMVSKIKFEVDRLEEPSFQIDICHFTNGELAIILLELTRSGYSAYGNQNTLTCRRINKARSQH